MGNGVCMYGSLNVIMISLVEDAGLTKTRITYMETRVYLPVQGRKSVSRVSEICGLCAIEWTGHVATLIALITNSNNGD